MKRLCILALFAMPLLAGFRVDGTDPAPWRKIFGAINLAEDPNGEVVVVGSASKLDVNLLAQEHFVVLEACGLSARNETLTVRQIRDEHAPETQIIWEQPVPVTAFEVPSDWTVFARERWKNTPVVAGKRTAHGALLWIASSPGAAGYERYPYLLQAAVDLGLEAPVRTMGLHAFFDSSYRIRADVDYLAKRWRAAGISVLEVAAWHNMDADPAQDEYLTRLIEACHRHAILVYAWFELPHVSEAFWAAHPEWREQTAAGQDAQLDWRKLMNLQNPDCQKEAARQIASMLGRFDWDGVNLAELYFESLEGAANPARFTPMNSDVRTEFKEIGGFDPKLLFDASSPYSHDKAALRKFLDFRSVLAARMQSDWLKQIEWVRKAKPYLHVELTHIDDRFDPATRDELGADVARVLPVLRSHGSTLLVEDPANLWDLGPDRYTKLATSYQKLRPDMQGIAVDINVVERYQDVYPTKKQTGTELFELVHAAAESFAAVALYGENSIEKQDLQLLPAAAACAVREGDSWRSSQPIRLRWHGSAMVDGMTWPLANANEVLLPAGQHTVTTGGGSVPFHINDVNADVKDVRVTPNSVVVEYTSKSRAIVELAEAPRSVAVDGHELTPNALLILPSGSHSLTLKQ